LRRSFPSILAIVATALLAMPAGAEMRGITLEPSERLVTSIGDPSDEDVFVFEALAGSTLKLKVSRKKKSEVTPAVTLLGEDGTPIDLADVTRETPKRVRVKGFVMPSSGRYFLEVRSRDGGTGEYEILLSLKPVRRTRSAGLALHPGKTLDYSIQAETGARLKAKIRAKGGPVPGLLAVLGPDGGEIAGAVSSFQTRGSKLWGALDLESGHGSYALRVGGVDARTVLDVRMSVRFPKRKKSRRAVSGDEPRPTSVGPAASFPGAEVTVFGENFESGARVFLGEDPVETWFVSSVELQIVVPPPPAPPAGPVDVHVLNPDGQQNTLVDGLDVGAAPLGASVTLPPSSTAR